MNEQQQQLYNQLFDSIANNKCNEVDALINDVELKDYINNETEYTKLLYAAGVEHNHVEMVEMLLKNTHSFGYFAAPIIAEVCKKGHLDVFKLLLNARAFDPEMIKNDQGLLSNACLSGNSQLVDFLIKQGAEPNESTLNIACAAGHLPIVEQLTALKVEVTVPATHPDNRRIGFYFQRADNPFASAAQNNQMDVLEHLLKNHQGKLGDITKLLRYVCEADNPEMLDVLARNGFDFTNQDDINCLGETTSYLEDILKCICVKGSIKLLNHIIDKIAPKTINICLRNSSSTYPLHHACLWGHVDLVDVLLKKGADVSVVDSQGYTPLHYACMTGQVTIIERLLLNGSSKLNFKINARSHSLGSTPGETPLSRAISGTAKNHVLLNIIEQLGMYGVKIKDGLDIAIRHRRGLDVIECLLKLKPKLEQKDYLDKYTPLFQAIRFNRVDIVKLLLQWGSDVNALDRYNKTPLMFAAWLGDIEIVKILLEKPSINVSARNLKNLSAADLARSPEIKDLINEHEAKLLSEEESSSISSRP